MDIYLIRHAEPDAETVLTPRGVEQAERLAEYLRPVPITHIYASPLARAQRTMQAVARGRAVTPVTLDWLKELNGNMGVGHSTWTTSAAELEADPTFAGRIAEYMSEQLAEVLRGFDALLAEHGYERQGWKFARRAGADDSAVVAVFAHGGLIATLLAGLFRLPLADFYAATHYRCTGITHLRVEPGRRADLAEPRIMSFAACCHLGPAGHLEL